MDDVKYPVVALTPEQVDLTVARMMRSRVREAVVIEYAAVLAKLPPSVVFFDGAVYWLADGLHRWHAHRHAKRKALRCEVRKGTRHQAVLYAASCNGGYGIRPDFDDLRSTVLALDAERRQPGAEHWSNREIAARIGVSHEFVNKALNAEKQAPDGGHAGGELTTVAKTTPDAPSLFPENPGQDSDKDAGEGTHTTNGRAPRQPKQPKKQDDAAPPSAPGSPPPAPVTDAWGIPVQPHALEAFALAGRFDELVATLRGVARELSALVDTPAGAHLIKQVQWVRTGKETDAAGEETATGKWVLAHLENAIKAVAGAKPTVTDCPYVFNEHKAHEEGCTLCRDARWLAATKGHHIPPNAVTAMKAHYGIKDEEVA